MEFKLTVFTADPNVTQEEIEKVAFIIDRALNSAQVTARTNINMAIGRNAANKWVMDYGRPREAGDE